MAAYDPGWVRSFYDEYGEREWTRWDESPVQQVKWHVHLHYLTEYLRPDDRVLEVGAGAGRFTRELTGLVRSIVVADISPGQLQLNRAKAEEFGFAESVEDWIECDMCDMSAHFDEGAFDAVVCYGGPLSYVFEERGRAIRELTRVTRPGGTLFLSVMSLWGGLHQFLPGVLKIEPAVNRDIVATGDLTADRKASTHYAHMFRSSEFRELLEASGLQIEVLSASNCVSACWAEALREIKEDPTVWAHLLEMELEACREPGCLDMGTHLIAVCRKPA